MDDDPVRPWLAIRHGARKLMGAGLHTGFDDDAPELAIPDLEEGARRTFARADGSPLRGEELARMTLTRGSLIARAAVEAWQGTVPALSRVLEEKEARFIDASRWDWFGTLTVAGPEPSRGEFERRMQRWLREVASDANAHLVVAYVIAPGRWRGRVHSHLLVSLPRDAKRDRPCIVRARARWTLIGPGIADLRHYERGRGACEYIANHFTGDDDTRCVTWIACPRHRMCRRRSCLAAQCAFPLGPRLI